MTVTVANSSGDVTPDYRKLDERSAGGRPDVPHQHLAWPGRRPPRRVVQGLATSCDSLALLIDSAAQLIGHT